MAAIKWGENETKAWKCNSKNGNEIQIAIENKIQYIKEGNERKNLKPLQGVGVEKYPRAKP